MDDTKSICLRPLGLICVHDCEKVASADVQHPEGRHTAFNAAWSKLIKWQGISPFIKDVVLVVLDIMYFGLFSVCCRVLEGGFPVVEDTQDLALATWSPHDVMRIYLRHKF